MGSLRQLILRSETRYFSKGSIIADYRDDANGLMVVTSGKVSLWDQYIHGEKKPRHFPN
jgi:hypothetical protein